MKKIKYLSSLFLLLFGGSIANADSITLEMRNNHVNGNVATFDLYVSANADYNTTGGTWGSATLRVLVDPSSSGATLPSNANVSITPGPGVSTAAINTSSGAPGSVAGLRFNMVFNNLTAIPLTSTPVLWGSATLTFTSPPDVSALKRLSPWNNGPSGSSYTTSTAGFRGTPLMANAPLPVSLIDFSAKPADANRVQLNWKTSNEQNTASFEVEHATDGKAFNEVVAKMNAAGNTSNERLYQAYDNSPVKGTNYYRLKMADLSGKTVYSEIRTVRFDGKATDMASFYPNPLNSDNVANAHLKIVASADQRLAYIISDAGGRMVRNGSIAVVTGTETYKVDGLTELAAGAYFITLNGTTIKATLKLNKTQ